MNTRTSLVALCLAAAFAVRASGAIIYTSTNDGTGLARIDSTSGVGTFVGSYGAGLGAGFALTIDNSTGTLYTLMDSYNNGRLATVNASTGAATVFGVGNGISNMMILETANDGTLFSASWSTNSLYTMNKTTGVATLVGSLGFNGVMDFAFDTTGTLWATNSASLYKVNTTTGAGAFVANLSGISGNMGIAFDDSNRLFGTQWGTANSPLWEINTTTGVATVINNTGLSSPHGGDILHNVPDSGATFTLMGAALLGLAALRRQWRR